MEAEVQALLDQAKGFASEKEVGKGEELEMKHLSVEESKARRQELRQLRELAFREERKAARVKKIKSKAYHRIKKREKQRILAKQGEEEGEGEDESEQALLDRAKERMTLRHKRVGKWAKGSMMRTAEGREAMMEEMRLGEELRRRIEIYGDDDDDEDGQRGQEEEDEAFLAQGTDQSARGIRERAADRMRGILEGTGEEGEEEEGVVKGSKLLQMAFMKKAARAKENESRQMMEEMMEQDGRDEDDLDGAHEEKEGGQRVSGNVGRRIWGQEGTSKDQASSSSLETQSSIPAKSSTKKGLPKSKDPEEGSSPIHASTSSTKSAPTQASAKAENPWLAGAVSEIEEGAGSGKVRMVIKKKKDGKDAGEATLQLPTARGDQVKDGPGEEGEGEEGDEVKWSLTHSGSGGRKAKGGPLLGEQKALVERAFAGDGDVVEQEFAREKEEAMEEEVERALGKKSALQQDVLPGWGSWGGKGVKAPSKKHKNAFLRKREEALAERKAEGERKKRGRKDAKLKDVHISEKRQRTTLTKYSVDKVPFPFKTREQYERSLAAPLGKEWNAQQAHQELVLPRVITKAGRVIDPLQRAEESTR